MKILSFRFICVLVGAIVSAPPLSAQVIAPTGLAPGAQYQLLFVTSGTDTSTSSNIADYNSFVTAQAALSPTLPTAIWHAVASTATVNANQNAPWISGLPVYNTHGVQLTSGAASLYNHSLLAAILYDQHGLQDSSLVWTGSSFSGAAQGPLGGATVSVGASNNSGLDWIHDAVTPTATELPLYALSGAITVPVPEPGTIVLAALGALCCAAAIGRKAAVPV